MTQTLTTERLREIASSPSFSANPLSHEVKYMARELLANREAQPVALVDRRSAARGSICWQGGGKDLPHGTELFTAPPAPVVNPEFTGATAATIPDKVSCEGFDPKDWVEARNLGQCEGWNAYRAELMAQPVSQGCNWIACSEKMPEPNKYVQVSNGVWVGIGMYNDAEHFEDDERWQDEHNEFIDLLHHPVTHWMPLPAAPEGGNG
ncbi:DUF551 domain-containing protein [Pseudomonas lundensis]|uniref:DUF551 domain-containing protein n=1 Tax=Serratia proteamaculans TaxID=28151 RepID=UPI0029812F0A|nr:DUF551 domain-containing protein [Serratia proteamaculans]MDW5502937.1 DUF551 domain-containing protein [Serratia proteamaculans]MDW5507992.1 DUF551 domain-containing protein [Pseudomonas lundensis]